MSKLNSSINFIKYFFLILIASSCNSNTENSSSEIKKDCFLGEERLDNTSDWQGEFINPENVPSGYVLLSAHISSSDNYLGIITVMNKTDSLATLFFVKEIDNSNNYKILGIKKLNKLTDHHSYISMCSSTCNLTNSSITGLVTIDSNDQTKTDRAWGIDIVKGKLIKINPNKIDCNEANNATYD